VQFLQTESKLEECRAFQGEPCASIRTYVIYI